MILLLASLAYCAIRDPRVIVIPTVYALTACAFDAASRANWRPDLRIHATMPPPSHVVRRVLSLFLVQCTLDLCSTHVQVTDPQPWTVYTVTRSFAHLFTAAVALDTYQYWAHRVVHAIPVLYARVHRHHHTLRTPTAWGALYNSFLECVFVDVLSFYVAQTAANLTPNEALLLGTIATVKTVSDHSGYVIFGTANDAAYHAAHHALGSGNFEQPFFTFWDDAMGTRLPRRHELRNQRAMQK